MGNDGVKSIYCAVSLEDSIHARKCFMTGEYCSKQTNIQKERDELHRDKKINAFVIMNFSDMSDVVYKWRLRDFITSLKKYLYIDTDNKMLYCVDYEYKNQKRNIQNYGGISASNEKVYIESEKVDGIKEENLVSEIRVLRSDSEPASNYVVCNRICQQMQIADLVIVDLSSQNPNVFYELGMAIAFGKLILPICFSESYYKMVVPEQLEKLIGNYKNTEAMNELYDGLKHHIDCYPWRRKLFEFYGVLFKRMDKAGERPEDRTRYGAYIDVTTNKYGFSDIKYSRFPYHEKINDDNEIIGEKIYTILQRQYNESKYKDNTLVVYTMDAFLNEEQAGRCIVNFYRNITARMKQEECFCGERVGVLVQSNAVPENDKDSKKELYLNYNIGEIIQIGVNQATYLCEDEKIKTDDVLNYGNDTGEDGNKEIIEKEISRYIRGYNRNKGLLLYPDNPIYVERIKNKLQEDLLDISQRDQVNLSYNPNVLLLFHIMLRTLRYTKQIVVDISNNSLQSLFWLGAAHGKGVNAITVFHEETEKEREILTGIKEKKVRNIFDVAGLWAAVFQSNDTEGFYKQLAAVYEGMERNSKLILSDYERYKKLMYAFVTRTYLPEDKSPEEVIDEKTKEEKKNLESYYRSRILNQMLCYNRLNLYLEEADMIDPKNRPKGYTSKWDFQAVSALSNYLSKRSLIGEYRVEGMEKNAVGKKSQVNVNYICIGQEATSGNEKIIEIANKELRSQKFHEKWEEIVQNGKFKALYNGFKEVGCEDTRGIIAHLPEAECKCFDECTCEDEYNKNIQCEYDKKDLPTECMIGKRAHIQIGQLVLWRTASVDDGRVYFYVGLNGSSGPATYALATLLINEEQKELCLGSKQNDYLLCILQDEVRKQLLQEFERQLKDRLRKEVFQYSVDYNGHIKNEQNNIPQLMGQAHEEHIKLIIYTTCNYLSTILYQYFFPFLLDEDIKTIRNSLFYFIKTMKAANKSPFAFGYRNFYEKWGDIVTDDIKMNKIMEIVPDVLFKVLKEFRGVESFYKIDVEHSCTAPSNKEENVTGSESNAKKLVDSRKIRKISSLNNKVSCLFVKDE